MIDARSCYPNLLILPHRRKEKVFSGMFISLLTMAQFYITQRGMLYLHKRGCYTLIFFFVSAAKNIVGLLHALGTLLKIQKAASRFWPEQGAQEEQQTAVTGLQW